MITDDLKDEYPFKSHYLKIGKNKYHYIDEGEGACIVLVHGNPTWSFYFRNIIKELSTKYRVIAPDHMGCGFSDQPQDYEYTLESRVSDLSTLMDSLKLKKYSMLVHDWGGAIGFGHATSHIERIEKVIILNTAAFLSTRIPFSIRLCKMKLLGPFIIKYLNAFCYPATFMTTEKKMPEKIKKGYLLPYLGAAKRRAISEFVQDIPLGEKHRSYQFLKEIEGKLPLLEGEKLILWGGRDFCFNDEFYNRWCQIYPKAEKKYYKNAGHYIIEDEKEDSIEMIQQFLKG